MTKVMVKGHDPTHIVPELFISASFTRSKAPLERALALGGRTPKGVGCAVSRTLRVYWVEPGWESTLRRVD